MRERRSLPQNELSCGCINKMSRGIAHERFYLGEFYPGSQTASGRRIQEISLDTGQFTPRKNERGGLAAEIVDVCFWGREGWLHSAVHIKRHVHLRIFIRPFTRSDASPLSPSTILPACLCWTLLGGWCRTLRNIAHKTSIGGSSTEEVPLDHSDVIGSVFQDWTGFITLSRNEEYQNLLAGHRYRYGMSHLCLPHARSIPDANLSFSYRERRGWLCRSGERCKFSYGSSLFTISKKIQRFKSRPTGKE
ncbi:hypothetical protein EV424DRAFT_600483 [Suillus variegatus]|nr:hypothetical protein EV424DRAFT_600483 [Suillus variegatus]